MERRDRGAATMALLCGTVLVSLGLAIVFGLKVMGMFLLVIGVLCLVAGVFGK